MSNTQNQDNLETRARVFDILTDVREKYRVMKLKPLHKLDLTDDDINPNKDTLNHAAVVSHTPNAILKLREDLDGLKALVKAIQDEVVAIKASLPQSNRPTL